jgi:hypothetical protein
VHASIDGGSSVPLLVDTGSAGLVIPWQDLGSGSELSDLLSLGLPSSFGESGYSGGVDYIYLTYNSLPVDYLNGGTDALSTTGPVDVEVYSWDPGNLGSLFTNNAFENFLGSNDVSGILGVGDNASGPTTSPFESYGGVLVDATGKDPELIVGSSAPTGGDTVSGAPISSLYESVNGGTPLAVSDDVDSGGVYGTIPSSLTTSVPDGTVISVYDNSAGTGTPLYSYMVEGDAPTLTSGTSIDSGVEPFLQEPIYIDYTNDMMTFYPSS